MNLSKRVISTILLSILLTTLGFSSKIKPPLCDINIATVKNMSGKFVIELTYDKRCEIVMNYSSDEIILKPKKKGDKVKTNEKLEDNKTTFANNEEKVNNLLSLAKSKIGSRYSYGKTGPDHFDCSGFVYFLFKKAGSPIPRTSREQSESGDKIKREDLQKGDMLFFDTSLKGHVNHSGVYLGNGEFIHSSSGKAYGVTISKLDSGFYLDKFRWGVRKKIKNKIKDKTLGSKK